MSSPPDPTGQPGTPSEALETLLAGNARHVAGEVTLQDPSPLAGDPTAGQQPFAAIIGCADSRVSPTLAFDLQRGNLFCPRVAGNVIDPGVAGSTEFAVSSLGVKLVMVLGHTDCGGVKGAMAAAEGQEFPAAEFGHIGGLVEAIRPSVERLPADDRTVENCVAANARDQAAQLAAMDPIIRPAIDAGDLRVVAAVYDIGSGRVTVLD